MKVTESRQSSLGSAQFTVLSLDGERKDCRKRTAVVGGSRYELLYMSGGDMTKAAISGLHDFPGKDISFV